MNCVSLLKNWKAKKTHLLVPLLALGLVAPRCWSLSIAARIGEALRPSTVTQVPACPARGWPPMCKTDLATALVCVQGKVACAAWLLQHRVAQQWRV